MSAAGSDFSTGGCGMSSHPECKRILPRIELPSGWMGTRATNFHTGNAAIGSDEQPQAI